MIDRRGVLAGAAVSLLASRASAKAEQRLFASGPLATNGLAQTFYAPSEPLRLPDIRLVGAHDRQSLSRLPGKTWLVSLWSEWCAPCLMEAGDLAQLGQTYGGSGFGIVFVLTASHKKLDFVAARDLLARYRAGGAALLVEPGGRDSVMQALAAHDYPPELRAVVKQDRGVSLPCNLLVDRHGRVRGRSFGATSIAAQGSTPHGGAMTEADKARVLTERSSWSTPAGAAVIAALASGALEKT